MRLATCFCKICWQQNVGILLATEWQRFSLAAGRCWTCEALCTNAIMCQPLQCLPALKSINMALLGGMV